MGTSIRLLLATVTLGSVGAFAVWSCTATPAGLAEGCTINSECASPLVCVFGRCHEACAETRDCPIGQRCVPAANDKVCELPAESQCSVTQRCAVGLVCAAGQCRGPCSDQQACPSSQRCVSGACYDPEELDAGSNDAQSDATDAADATDAGCDPSVGDGGLLGYTPSNFDLVTLAIVDGSAPDGGLVLANPPNVVVIGTQDEAVLGPNHALVTLSDQSLATLYVVGNLTVTSTAVLTILSSRDSQFVLHNYYPIIIASLGTVDIQGLVAAGGIPGYPGPGGSPPTYTLALGPGGGGGGFSFQYPTSAAGGGSFCGKGGNGSGSGNIAPGGSTYGDPTLVPLISSSAGGLGVPVNFPGPSGGSLQISARKGIFVRTSGAFNVGGAGYHGGGGAGGALLLEAPTITLEGALAANGGGGGSMDLNTSPLADGANGKPNGDPAPGGGALGGMGSAGTSINGANGSASDAGVGAGGGGAGYIRLNTACGATIASGATVSPSLTTKCATQGTLKR